MISHSVADEEDGLAHPVCGNGRTCPEEASSYHCNNAFWRMKIVTIGSQHPTDKANAHVAVVFLANDVNRFSINALTGAIEQDPELHVQLAFPHPRSVSACQAEIKRLLQEGGPAGTVVVAFSFKSSALVTTAQLLKQLREGLAGSRRQLLFLAGGPHASGDAVGTLAMGFDVVFIGKALEQLTKTLTLCYTSLNC
jgi:hypothetical protein